MDDRISQPVESDLISLSELCSMLSISVATGRNWIRLGKLTPQSKIKRTAYFSAEYARSVKDSLKSGENKALRNRRNKKYVSGSNIYNSYVSENSDARTNVQTILDYISENNLEIGDLEIAAFVAECAVQLFLRDAFFPHAGNCLEAYLNGSVDLDGYGFLIDDLLADKEDTLRFIEKHKDIFNISYQYEGNEDILGLIYISIKNLGVRKATGSYYTPTKIVRKLCNKLFEINDHRDKRIIDPCCGTGNFLLQLPDDIAFENIFGNDNDELSVKIARINLAVKFSVNNKELLYAHVTHEDYLNHSFEGKFDFIIGNPPWGYEFSEEERALLRRKYRSAARSNIESYDVFIEQALTDLSEYGVLSFVLPEALLNVKTHMPVRKILVQSCSFQYLDYLGNVFDKVQCPCVIFQIENTGTPAKGLGMEICDGKREYVIECERDIDYECFSFLTTDEEYDVLNKIGVREGKCFLGGHAKFALGIVTGNNKKYISTARSSTNEMVLSGSDIFKYRFKNTKNYIEFNPESLQQAAPTECYRAPEKLLYRFICNQLVFAYDNEQTLSLNSCNLLIPRIDGLSVKYVLAVLNSRIAQYYFKKTFNSVKVLRSHIEQIPIPLAAEKQQEDVTEYVEKILSARDDEEIVKNYDELDRLISDLYGLTDSEYSVIINSMKGENLFLL